MSTNAFYTIWDNDIIKAVEINTCEDFVLNCPNRNRLPNRIERHVMLWRDFRTVGIYDLTRCIHSPTDEFIAVVVKHIGRQVRCRIHCNIQRSYFPLPAIRVECNPTI